jgi:hypothetical protein
MNRRLPPGQQRQARPQQPPWTHGPIERVPCPHCGHANDFRELHSEQLLDTGHEIDCGHCGRMMEVTAMRQITVIAVRPISAHGGGAQRGRAQATTIGHAQLNRLLRG